MTVIRYGAKATAALFMLGLWAAAPQAIGTASADDTATVGASAPAGAGPVRASRGGAKPSAAPPKAKASASQSPNARPVGPAVKPLVRAAAAVPVRRAAGGAVSNAVRSQAAVATVASASPSGIVTPLPSDATIAVTKWFSESWSLLAGFDNPLAAALQTALVGVHRTLFSPAPVVKPEQLTSWTPGDPILGALRYVQPGGAPVYFQVTQAPASGTVQLLSDGTYTYVPGESFQGTDSFTVQVTSGGVNLLEPFTPRTASFTVDVKPRVLLQANADGYFTIINLTPVPATMTKWWTEPGYESNVGRTDKDSVLLPGESKTFVNYLPLFGNFDTRAEFTNTVGNWRVVMASSDLSFFSTASSAVDSRCEVGACGSGRLSASNPVLFLYGPATTEITLDRTSPNAIYSQNLLEFTSGDFFPFNRGTLKAKDLEVQPTKPDDYTNLELLVGSVNASARPYTYSRSHTETFSATTGSNWEATFGVDASGWTIIKKAFSLNLEAKYGRQSSETTTSSTTDEVILTFPPYSRYTILVGNPTASVTGDLEITWANGSRTLYQGFDTVFPDPNAQTPGMLISPFFGPTSEGFSVRDKNPPVRPENPPNVVEPTYAVGNIAQLYVQGYNGDTVNLASPDFTSPSVGKTVYTSSDPSVATVDGVGKVTAVGVGDAVINVTYTYTLQLGGGKTEQDHADAAITVHVKAS